MSRQTIGEFISALRKSKGLTQKQLAEMLNVSDKAVSRWERNESAPDLSLIPAIADIFGVTCDEILKGCKSTEDKSAVCDDSDVGEKRAGVLLNRVKARFTLGTASGVGVSFVGFLACVLCNTGFNRAYVGFFISCIFQIISLVIQFFFTYSTYGKITGIVNEEINKLRKYVFYTTATAVSVILCVFSVTLPTLYVPFDTYMGVTGETWISEGIMCFLVYVFVCAFVFGAFFCFKMKNKKMLITICVCLFVVFVLHGVVNSYANVHSWGFCTTFEDLDEFKKYMESGSENELLADCLHDKEGNVVLEFYWNNEEAASMSVDYTKDGTPIPSVTTRGQYRQYAEIKQNVDYCFYLAYPLSIVCTVLFFKIRNKSR